MASSLLKALGDWATGRNVSRLQLLADRDNSPALGFYASANWQMTALICLRKHIPAAGEAR
jgi:hypothetical protein